MINWNCGFKRITFVVSVLIFLFICTLIIIDMSLVPHRYYRAPDPTWKNTASINNSELTLEQVEYYKKMNITPRRVIKESQKEIKWDQVLKVAFLCLYCLAPWVIFYFLKLIAIPAIMYIIRGFRES